MNIRKKIFFLSKGKSPFVLADLNILSERYTVITYFAVTEKGYLKNLKDLFKIALNILLNIVSIEAIVVWFSDYHSFPAILFSKLFRKKSILILGGYDVNQVPEIGYGVHTNIVRKFCNEFSIKYADFLLPVDKSLWDTLKKRKTKILGKLIVLPTGYNKNFWFSDTSKKKQVISVAVINDIRRFKLKGMDLLIEVAKLMPEVKFVVIGVADTLKHYFTEIPNIEVLNKIDQKELRKYYAESKVFCLLSKSEGLPNVIAESMLCECIPVAFPINGIPNLINKYGYLLNDNDIEVIRNTLQMALNESDELGKKARLHISNRYSLQKRKKRLFEILEKS